MSIKIKCPNCKAAPSNNSYSFELIEPAVCIRKLAITLNKKGEVENIEGADYSHDEGDGESQLGCRKCGTSFAIPKGFWDFDIYG